MKVVKMGLVLLILISILSACTPLGNPFKEKAVTSSRGCIEDIQKPIELERLRFKYPPAISLWRPCEAILVMHDKKRDSFIVSADGVYLYNDVAALYSAFGFSVNSQLDLYGIPSVSPMARWSMNARLIVIDKKITQEKRLGMECWRGEILYSLDGKEKYSKGIDYSCLDPKGIYPPIHIEAGYKYQEGKSLYPGDIQADIIDPIFATLELKEVAPETIQKIIELNRDFRERLLKWQEKRSIDKR